MEYKRTDIRSIAFELINDRFSRRNIVTLATGASEADLVKFTAAIDGLRRIV
jgi:hypothetical protein